MLAARFVLLCALSRLVSAYTVPPPTTAPEDTIEDCTDWIVGSSSDTCEAIASDYLLTLAQLYRYNPLLAGSCNVQEGLSYCVEENWGIPPPEPTTTTSSAIPSTTSGNGIHTPTPTQSGMVSTCNKFHYVEKGQSCGDILALYSLNLETFYSWNTGVGTTCNTMWAEVYVCVGVVGSSTTSTASATTTGNGISTPTPTQPGMVSNCNKFHYVEENQSCADILTLYRLSLETFYSWNSGVGETCTSMWAKVYVCVGVVGGGVTPAPTTTSSPTSTTTSGNGISTPTPTQPGMVSNCDKFNFIEKGATCGDILSRNGLTLEQFYALNTGVGATCQSMWAEVYVCVHAIGAPTSTTFRTSTTTTRNGVPTPTPTMPGMVENCKTFYKVVSGDTCSVISSKTGVSVANIIKWNPQVGSTCNVWLDYYICVGI